MASPVPQKDDVEKWTVEQVAAWLRQMELTDCCEVFLRRGIDGRSLTELTEEGLILWGRDVSIRNRKKILRLGRQIENQHLISTGKQHQRQVSRSQQRTAVTSHTSSDKESETNNGAAAYDSELESDDDNFSSDEFDDDDVENEPLCIQSEIGHGDCCGSTDSDDEENPYLEPLPVCPKPPPRPLPNQPVKPVKSVRLSGGVPPHNRPPFLPPEKRPQLPLPPSPLNTSPRIGPRKLTPSSFSELSKKGPAPTPNLPVVSPRRTPPIPGPLRQIEPKPVVKREWPPKKPSESPSGQNSNQPESNVEGGGLNGRKALQSPHRRGPAIPPKEFHRAEATDNEYEIVESPLGTYTGNESHSGSPSGHTPSNQEPPPLPQRNQDGRDSSWSGPNPSVVSSTRLFPPYSGPSNRVSSTPGTLNINQNRLSHHLPNTLNNNQSKPLPNPLNNNQSKPLPNPLNNNQSKPLPNPSIPSSSGGPPNFIQKRKLKLVRSASPPVPQSSLVHAPHVPVNSPPKERAPSCPPSASALPKSAPPVERIPIGGGLTFELSPLYRSLMERSYFHLISRSKSKELLENAADGVFLIRPSTRSSDPLTLCLRYSGRTYNINIRQRYDGLFALGTEKVNEMTFASVGDIVSTYTGEPIKLQSGNHVTLANSPAKLDHIYVKMPESSNLKY